jgi:hypothetical protein
LIDSASGSLTLQNVTLNASGGIFAGGALTGGALGPPVNFVLPPPPAPGEGEGEGAAGGEGEGATLGEGEGEGEGEGAVTPTSSVSASVMAGDLDSVVITGNISAVSPLIFASTSSSPAIFSAQGHSIHQGSGGTLTASGFGLSQVDPGNASLSNVTMFGSATFNYGTGAVKIPGSFTVANLVSAPGATLVFSGPGTGTSIGTFSGNQLGSLIVANTNGVDAVLITGSYASIIIKGRAVTATSGNGSSHVNVTSLTSDLTLPNPIADPADWTVGGSGCTPAGFQSPPCP